jgi:predicted  nucleic acid-binding Zn-ribbon protein
MRMVAVTMAILMFTGNNMLAQDAKVEDASARELAKLNATMRQVADLLTKLVAQGQLDLLMKRTQMATDQVERAETQLRQAQDERASVEGERSRLQSQRDMTAQGKMPEAERDTILAGIDPELKRLAQRQSTLEGRIVELQNRIAERQDELRGWQALLDRRLSGQ